MFDIMNILDGLQLSLPCGKASFLDALLHMPCAQGLLKQSSSAVVLSVTKASKGGWLGLPASNLFSMVLHFATYKATPQSEAQSPRRLHHQNRRLQIFVDLTSNRPDLQQDVLQRLKVAWLDRKSLH